MRSSLVGLQLLLACILVWGTSVVEEKKECCRPGVPPEKSCCPNSNSTSQEPEGRKEPVVAAEPNSEEMEERGKEYRERMQNNRSPYEAMFLKQKALDYFNKYSSGAFYRPIEDTDVKVKSATGIIVAFTQFLVNTNCTKEEGRRSSTLWYEPEPEEKVPCVALPKHEQKKVKCKVYIFLDARSGHSAVVQHKCEQVVFWEGSEDTLDLDHLLKFSPVGFEPSF